MPGNRMVRFAPRSAGFYGGLAAVARGAINAYSKRKRQRTQASNSDDKPASAATGTPSSFQNDRINLYSKRRRRGSRRSKIRASRFRKRVKAIINSSFGPKCLVRQSSNFTSAPINTLGNICFYINGCNDAVYADLKKCMDDFNQGGAGAVRGDILHMKSSSSSLTLANKTGSGTVMYVTLYYFTCRKSLPEDEYSPLDKYIDSFTQNILLPTSTSVLAGNKSATPFMAGTWCQHFLITKITRITLADGQQTTFDMRYTKPFTIRNETMQDYCAVKGLTRGVLAVFHGGLSSTGDYDPVTISYNFSRSYYGIHAMDSFNACGQD